MIDIVSLIKTVGYLGLFGIVFAESGLLIGLFLPGDSLLFTAGFLASRGYLNIWILISVTFIAAILGDSVGYEFGKRVGVKIFKKEDSIFFHKDHIRKAQVFFEKYGPLTIIMARFIPIIRTFAPILAGVGKMSYRTFLIFNIAGAVFWAIGLSLFGYFLGNIIPNIDSYLLPIIFGIIFLSVLPSIIHVLKNKDTRSALWNFVKKIFLKIKAL